MHLRRHLKSFGFLLVTALALIGQPAFATTRVALVMGNSKYQKVPALANPDNDAATFAATMTKAGFDVVDSRYDLSEVEMRRALREFADKARNADVAVIYFAGHGIEVEGTNYLIPVDAVLERDTDVYDEALSLDRVLVAVEPAKQLRLVILDACRDNPFSKTMKRVGQRSIGRGLARIEPATPNTLIAYAAKAGSTAADGDSRNSPFTAALVRHIATPGLDLRKAFGFVRDD
ncbi:MAG: caspase family protein, partial [Proteobacteria bacterium]|nr:caspase family protein [Pseudomonadota bacterium]